jgi:hypothetical protein
LPVSTKSHTDQLTGVIDEVLAAGSLKYPFSAKLFERILTSEFVRNRGRDSHRQISLAGGE